MTADPATKRTKPAVEVGDCLMTAALLVLMILAFRATSEWPANAAFFPRLLSGLGIILVLVRIAILCRAFIRGRRSETRAALPATSAAAESDGEDKQIAIEGPDSDEEGDENELHDIFATADFKTWAGVIGWFALFFVGLYLVGFIAILVVFTVAYLRVVEKTKYWHCAVYVLGTAGIIYGLFVVLLHLPLPLGLLTAQLGF